MAWGDSSPDDWGGARGVSNYSLAGPITVAIKDVPTRSRSVDWERSGTHNSKSKVLDAPFFVGRTPTGRYGTVVLAGATASVEEAAASKSPTARASASSEGANE